MKMPPRADGGGLFRERAQLNFDPIPFSHFVDLDLPSGLFGITNRAETVRAYRQGILNADILAAKGASCFNSAGE